LKGFPHVFEIAPLFFKVQHLCYQIFSMTAGVETFVDVKQNQTKKADGDKFGFSFWKYQFLHEKDRVILLWKSQSKFYYVPLLVF